MRSWIVALVLLSSANLQAGIQADEPGGALLPLQDRVGDPVLSGAIEETLYEELGSRHHLTEPVRLRDALRRLRIRDASLASPAALRQLAEEISVDWFFTATLHEATETELTRATQAFTPEAAVPVPQIILSARLLRRAPATAAGSGTDLGWVGFASASGLDGRNMLGLGVVEDPERLARQTVRRLVAAFAEKPPTAAEARPDRSGYLRQGLSVERLGSVAVVPFEGVNDRDAMVAAETVTDLAFAVLHENGVRLVPKGLVNQIIRRRGTLLRGQIDSPTRAALHTDAGADFILTGTVETWEIRRRGPEPEPRVGVGARLIDAESGLILWMSGLERGGWDGMHPFGTGRTHSQGRLAQQIMRSLVAGFLEEASPESR